MTVAEKAKATAETKQEAIIRVYLETTDNKADSNYFLKENQQDFMRLIGC